LQIPLFLLLLLPTAACCATPELGALLTRLQRPAPQHTDFVEIRYSKLLSAPLRAAGSLEFRGLEQLSKLTTTPFHERLAVDGDKVLVAREGERERRFSLSRAPELRGLLSSFGAILAGDRAMLERYFTATVSGDDAHWQLSLAPRESRTARRIRAVQVEGSADRANCFIVRETSGSESFLLVGETAAALPDGAPPRATVEALCRGSGTP
jgi:hypothetical protein